MTKAHSRTRTSQSLLSEDPLWYKDAIIYEVHIKSFFDANGDGMGDLKGVTRKLDYLADLGITAIWILPFYPSPLRDDGYDIADYYQVNPDYGTIRDFKNLLREAHARGLRVITELVINHTSDQHEWFQRARVSKPGTKQRDYYVWSDTPEKYEDARIIFKDFEPSNWTWDPVAKAYYWHRFYSHQPDLNFESKHVQKEIFKVLDYWLAMGVDGLRLDAIPYLFEEEGTNCENLPRTYEFIKELRAHVDQKFENRMLLAEANQWPEDAVEYFGDGDACHMAFHFPVMPRMFMSLQMEDRFPIIDILDQTPEIPENCQWAMFLRNHDELTLEMVTDEERDYMYRMYARDPRARINLGIRRRLAPLLENDRRKIELMNVILFAMPGSVVLYYGDEIGMGDNFYLGDRDGVRTPMQWSADRNGGFSKANPQRLYLPVIIDPEYHYEAVNVETQERNRSSLLWWMKNFIAMRKRFKAFGRGDIRFVLPRNPKVLAFIRTYCGDSADECENILVVVNLSRHPQVAELDMAELEGYVPEELFSHNRFPAIRRTPFQFTLNSYGYYLFSLLPPALDEGDMALSRMTCNDLGTGSFLDNAAKRHLESRVLPRYIRRRGWLGGREKTFKELSILEALPVGEREHPTWLIISHLRFTEGQPLTFNLLLSFAHGDAAERVAEENPHGVVCWYKRSADGEESESAEAKDRDDREDWLVYGGLHENARCQELLMLPTRRTSFKGHSGELTTIPGKSSLLPKKGCSPELKPSLFLSQRFNTLIVYGDAYILKIFRHAEEGPNPDVEISRFLTEEVGFENTPDFLGALEYTRNEGEPVVTAMLKEYVHSESDAWEMQHSAVERYLDRVLSARPDVKKLPPLPESPGGAANTAIPELMRELMSESDIELLGVMGRRLAELHTALATPTGNRDFATENFSMLYQRSVYQAMQARMKRTTGRMDQRLSECPMDVADDIATVLRARKELTGVLRTFHKRKIDCLKMRVHGDFHLAHLLYTGRDFTIIDFEGKPEKPLSQRRIKRSPFRDVGDMQRSFCHVAFSALTNSSMVRPEDRASLLPWTDLWHDYAFGAFLSAYLQAADGQRFIPTGVRGREDITTMLDAYIVDKAFIELDNAFDPLNALTTMDDDDDVARVALRTLLRYL